MCNVFLTHTTTTTTLRLHTALLDFFSRGDGFNCNLLKGGRCALVCCGRQLRESEEENCFLCRSSRSRSLTSDRERPLGSALCRLGWVKMAGCCAGAQRPSFVFDGTLAVFHKMSR